jgi:hypothetical protein
MRKGMRVRVNRGKYKGRLGTVLYVGKGGNVDVRLDGNSHETLFMEWELEAV